MRNADAESREPTARLSRTLQSMHGMNTSATEAISAAAQSVSVSEDTLTVDLVDGRTISVPLAWYPRLLNATQKERKAWRLIGRGEGIQWPDVEEDISVAGLLLGHPSFESNASLEKWLASRKRRRTRPSIRRGKPQ